MTTGKSRAYWPFVAAFVAVASAGCTSSCQNGGVSVDAKGNVVVRSESGFISPNSSILRNITEWPHPSGDESNYDFTQGYTLSADGTTMYVLENTPAYPNLVYAIDLHSGEGKPLLGNTNTSTSPAMAASQETSISTDRNYVYSVNQADARISRTESGKPSRLEPLIAGPRTKLRAPIAVAARDDGTLCALDSDTLFVTCYAPGASGDVGPNREIDTKAIFHFRQVDDLTFDREGHIVLAGTTDETGRSGFSIDVINVSGKTPNVIRTISGANAMLGFPNGLAVDHFGNILVLENNAAVLAFDASQHGNVAPHWVREPAAGVNHPFDITVDGVTGDVAILGSNGIAYIPNAGRFEPDKWPPEVHLPLHGWSVAFGNGRSLIVANEFGTPVNYGVPRSLKQPSTASAMPNLHNPDFIATDQRGGVYVASTDGTITNIPAHYSATAHLRSTSFITSFGRSLDAFAVDYAGHYYFSSTSRNAVIAIDNDGRERVIAGDKTRLDQPMGLAVDRDGLLFVANAARNDVLIFSRGASGNVAPIGEIAGPAASLTAPQALAIDSSGRLYVFDGPTTAPGFGAAHFVRIYALGARGDVAPVKSYSVNTKCWANAV